MVNLNTSMFVGAHFWFVPEGAAITSPSSTTVTQDGDWPDESEPTWPDFAFGICESCDIDPKYGPKEEILNPSPGAVKARDVLIPYSIPEINFTLMDVPTLAVQLALNTQKLWQTGVTQFNPNGGGGPGARGIIKAQKYSEKNKLILNYMSWVFLQLKSPLKMAPKTLTKPEFMATLLDSDNNTGSIDDGL